MNEEADAQRGRGFGEMVALKEPCIANRVAIARGPERGALTRIVNP